MWLHIHTFVLKFLSAPLISKCLTISSLLISVAIWSGVHPNYTWTNLRVRYQYIRNASHVAITSERKWTQLKRDTSSRWLTSNPCLMNNLTKFKDPVWALKCNKLAPSCCQFKDLFFSVLTFELTKYITLFSDILSSNYQHTSICCIVHSILECIMYILHC